MMGERRTEEKTAYVFLQEYAANAPDRKFLFSENRCFTADQTLSAVERVAGELYALGLRAGDCVALRATRSVYTVLLFLALQAIGVSTAMTDPHCSADNFLRDYDLPSPVKGVLTNEGASADVSQCEGWIYSDALGNVYGLDKDIEVSASKGEMLPFVLCEDNASPSMLIFTSGTTGKPKAVRVSQRAFVVSILELASRAEYRADDIELMVLPLNHIFALAVVVLALMKQHSMFFPERRDMDHVCSCIEKYGVTQMNGVPSIYRSLLKRKDRFSLSSLRGGLIAGGPYGSEEFIEIENTLGILLIGVYALSECVGVSCTDSRDPQSVRASGVGRPYAVSEVRIFDRAGDVLPVMVTGEIGVRGAALMSGYAGRSMTDTNEFFMTGDLGFLDGDGILHINGRRKDIIVRNGVNLSAVKIEQALMALPYVSVAAVVSVPHKRMDEVPYAAVVLTGGCDVTPEDLTVAASRVLAKNEIPYHIEIVSSLPMTPTGKVDKQSLREYFGSILQN